MNLQRVTITGADDSVKPAALIDLASDYPFVEWGLLFSGTRQGSPRYPSERWLHALDDAYRDQSGDAHKQHFSAHLCGRWVRELVLDGDFSWKRNGYPWLWWIFDRYQLNFHARAHQITPTFADFLSEHAHRWSRSFILQCDGVNDEAVRAIAEDPIIVPLFDASGGGGVVPTGWRRAWPGITCGYAGGLGPDNILDQLDRIAAAAGDETIWVDMESQVRTADDARLDLAKVKSVLDQVAPYVGQPV